MKKLIAAGAVVAAAVPLLTIAPAQADTPGCVTRTEFGQVKRGPMTRAQVSSIFDTAGRDTSTGGGYNSREYRACVHPAYSTIWVDYSWRRSSTDPSFAWRVDSKFAYWG